jgi:hypothetical protein
MSPPPTPETRSQVQDMLHKTFPGNLGIRVCLCRDGPWHVELKLSEPNSAEVLGIQQGEVMKCDLEMVCLADLLGAAQAHIIQLSAPKLFQPSRAVCQARMTHGISEIELLVCSLQIRSPLS